MSSIKGILSIARRAMSAQQAALNTTGHNIANVHTEGYTRQRVILEATKPNDIIKFSIGSGVQVQEIERIRSVYIDEQLRNERQSLARWETLEKNLCLIEEAFAEPSDAGLAALINQFWDVWHSLANNPDSKSARDSVQQKAEILINKFHQIRRELTDQQRFIEEEYSNAILDINSLMDQIVSLNHQIAYASGRGSGASDLQDKRDLLITEMGKFINVKTIEQGNGIVNLSFEGKVFIEHVKAVHLVEVGSFSTTSGSTQLKWEDGDTSSSVNSGSLSAFIELHDEVIPEYLEKLDTLAINLVEQVNSIHSTGYGLDGTTNNNFFKPAVTGAADIELDTVILNDNRKIASSSDGKLGNGDIALLIGQLQNELTMDLNSATFADYYRSLIFSIADFTQEAGAVLASEELFVEQLENQRQSISGVSLDEEMANLINYQRAYQAAARLVSVADEIAETVLELV